MVLALYSRACRDDYCTARTLIIAPPLKHSPRILRLLTLTRETMSKDVILTQIVVWSRVSKNCLSRKKQSCRDLLGGKDFCMQVHTAWNEKHANEK